MLRTKLPSYRLHKPSGQAVVRLSGRDIYLGPHSTKLSRDAYDRVVGEWLAGGRTVPRRDADDALTVAKLCAAFVTDGQVPASHRHEYQTVIKSLVRLYGRTAADAFRPLAVQALRQTWVAAGLKRETINDRMNKVRRVWRWGVEKELVSATTLHAIEAVAPLRAGKTQAPESEVIMPVPDDVVEATVEHMPRMLAAMVRVQLLTGMRAGELLSMRTCDIDTSKPVWVYKPTKHKTQRFGKVREIAIGPQAIEVLRPWLLPDLQTVIFNPARGEAERTAEKHAKRKTPLKYGNRPGQRTPPRGTRRQKPGKQAYTTTEYARAIRRVTEQLNPPPLRLARQRGETEAKWKQRLGPDAWAELKAWQRDHRWRTHQLRHAFGQKARDKFGADHTQAALGHSHVRATEVYARVALDKAVAVATAIG